MTASVPPTPPPRTTPGPAGAPQGGGRPPAGFGRGLRVLLIGSLALNLLIIGAIGGMLLSHPGRGPHIRMHDLGFGPFTAALSPDDRHALFESFRKKDPDFEKQRAAMQADFQTMLTALRAQPFDRQAFVTVMDRQKTRTDARLALGQSLLLDRIAAMSQRERQDFAARLEALPDRHHRRGGSRRDGGGSGGGGGDGGTDGGSNAAQADKN